MYGRLLLFISMVCLFGCNPAASVSPSKPTVWTLQTEHSDDRSESFVVQIFCEVNSAPVNIDVEEHTIDKLIVNVRLDSVNNRKQLFERKFSTILHNRGVDGLPGPGGRVVHPDFILPSGRILVDRSKDEIVFLFFDGDQMKLFKLDRASMTFVESDSKPFAKLLQDYYPRAFDPSDVYWSYALVRCAPFFGLPLSGEFNQTDTQGTEKLFRYWHQQIAARLP